MAVSTHLHTLLRHPILFLIVAAVAGCTVPEQMHVTEGTAPQNVDTDVRFRTTYYFRVFDYCWAANPALTPASDGGTTVRYRQIIPETDALYRYRMTGKSSALFNQIKFESGTLKKEQIDPFGTDVTFNADINGFLVRDEADAEAEVRAIADARGREADRAAALQRYQALSDLYKQLPESQGESEAVERIKKMKSTLETAMAQALEVYTGVAAQVPELLEAKLDKIAEDIMEVQKRLV